MSERLTAEEMALATDWAFDKHWPIGVTEAAVLKKLLAAAEEAQRLREAIEKHRQIRMKRLFWIDEDRELWEALK